MRTTRRDILLGAAAFGLAGIASRLPAYAQDASATPEKPELMFGVGGKPLFYYLPLTIAERKGFISGCPFRPGCHGSRAGNPGPRRYPRP